MTNRKEVIRELEREQQYLKRIIREAENRISSAPEGAVRTIQHGKSVQFYYRKTPADRNGVYIPASETKTAVRLMQKKYDEKIIAASRKQLKCIEKFLGSYDPGELQKVYRSVGKNRKPFIDAIELPDEEYVEKWQSVKYEGKGFAENSPEYYTQKGERVRSKSEVMIADALFRAGIPYRYEYPLKLGESVIYPDFTILRRSDREEVYLEHFGMMDDSLYRNNTFLKIGMFEDHGIIIGKRLFFTFETFKLPLNIKSVNSIIRNHLI